LLDLSRQGRLRHMQARRRTTGRSNLRQKTKEWLALAPVVEHQVGDLRTNLIVTLGKICRR
jgi:hypothetical protein